MPCFSWPSKLMIPVMSLNLLGTGTNENLSYSYYTDSQAIITIIDSNF